MKAITQILSEFVSQAFEIAGYDPSLGVVTASDRLDLCQFQCNGAFSAAKQYHKAPFIVAEQVAEVLKSDGIFSKVEVAKPGFLNLTLKEMCIRDSPYTGSPCILPRHWASFPDILCLPLWTIRRCRDSDPLFWHTGSFPDPPVPATGNPPLPLQITPRYSRRTQIQTGRT